MNSRPQSARSEVLERVTEQSQGQPAVESPEPIRTAQSAPTIPIANLQVSPRPLDQFDKPALAKSPCCGCCGG